MRCLLRQPFFLLLLFGMCTSVAQAVGLPEISWRAELPAAKASGTLSGALTAGPARHVVVWLDAPPDAATRAASRREGLELLDYLGGGAWFARLRPSPGLAKGTLVQGLAGLREVDPRSKIHPALAGPVWPEAIRIKGETSRAAAAGERLALHVRFFSGVDPEQAGVPIVRAYGGEVRARIDLVNALVVWLPADALEALAQEDGVQWIEPVLPPLSPTNDDNRSAVGADIVSVAPYNLDGAGIGAMVYDAGTARATHADFGGRLTVRDGASTSTHATHTSGTLGGSGAASGGRWRGMAPGVAIESYGLETDGTGTFLYTNPGDLEDDYTDALMNYGVLITNNSIGTNLAANGFPCEWEGDYNLTSMLIDSIAAGGLAAPLRVVWSAGNERGSGRCGTSYGTIAPPAGAKNAISVGAVNADDDTMTDFSGWGPTDDGRLKPDLVAPGCQTTVDQGVTSTTAISDTSYGVLCGTSMSAPTVTGVSALLLQAWRQRFPEGPFPGNAMLKAWLLHTAKDLGAAGPDYQFGYGALRAQPAVELVLGGTYVEDQLGQGEEQVYFLDIPADSDALRVTLAWDDAAGAVNTTPVLVNDLDLTLLSPTGRAIHYPWTLDPANPGAAATRTTADRRNNVEQIYVEAPAAGRWTVRVVGFNVPAGPQSFALVTTPDYKTATPLGVVLLDAATYGCAGTVGVRVSDTDLDLDTEVSDTATVVVVSDSDGAGETVLLTESDVSSGIFSGSLSLGAPAGEGVLSVSDGDMITVTYVDEDDGLGGADLARTDTAVVDCVAPALESLEIVAVSATRATVTIGADEAVAVRLLVGTSCGGTEEIVSGIGERQAHAVSLADLTPETSYFVRVELTDGAGNLSVDDNGGACHGFMTAARPDFFTELFDDGLDLSGRRLLLTPDLAAPGGYVACAEFAEDFPVDTAGAQSLTLGDDGFVAVALSGGATFPYFGTAYDTFYVGSNGYVTFDGGEDLFLPSLSDHFAVPRVSLLFADWNPGAGGSVAWRQDADRAVLTYSAVPSYNGDGMLNGQVSFYFDGRIEMAWPDVDAGDGLAGISAGASLSPDYAPSDLSGYDLCRVDSLFVTPRLPQALSGCAGSLDGAVCAQVNVMNEGEAAQDWTAAVDVAWLEVSTTGGILGAGSGIQIDVCANANANVLPPDTYPAVVTVTNVSTGVTQNRAISLTVNVPSDPATLVSPPDAATGVAPFPDLTWEASSDAACDTLYTVYLGTSVETLSPVCTGQEQTYCYAGQLADNTVYYWRVDGENCCGVTTGEVWSFTTGACAAPTTPAAAVTPVNAAEEVSVNTLLEWDTGLVSPAAFPVRSLAGVSSGAYEAKPGNALQTGEEPTGFAEVALFLDRAPWDNAVLQTALDDAGLSYDLYGSADMGQVSLAGYRKVILASVQPTAFHVALEANRAWFEAYVQAGGFLEMHLASFDNEPIAGRVLPGGLVVNGGGTDDVTVVEGDHPVLTEPNLLGNSDLRGWFFSALGGFSTVPAGTTTIVAGEGGGPCLVEVPVGAGAILATTLSVEWFYASPPFLQNLIAYEGATGGRCPTFYDVYLGASAETLALVCEGTRVPVCDPGQLAPEQTYAWKVVARNCCGMVESDVWTFSTDVCHVPPLPEAPEPTDAATGVLPLTDLSWMAGDGEDCPSTFDVYFGTSEESLELVCADTTSRSCALDGQEENTTYYWRVIAKNCCGETEGPLWSFTTGECVLPTAPVVPLPPDMAVGVPVNFNAGWEGGVSDSCPSRYDVYLGFAFDALFPILENQPAPSFSLIDLNPNTRYYWRVVATNCCGTSESAVWTFTTNDGSTCLDGTLPSGLPEQCFRFELDAQGFALNNNSGAGGGLWHWTDGGCFSDSPHLYFGRDETCNYDTGGVTEGTVTSLELDLTGMYRPLLAFDYFLATEAQPGLDVAAVLVSPNGGSFDTVAVNRSGQGVPWLCDDGAPLLLRGAEGEGEGGIVPTWKTGLVNLGPYAGETVRVRFAFSSVDGSANAFPGFGIDNMCIYETGEEAPATADFCAHLDDLRQADILGTLGGYGSLLQKLAPGTGDLNGGATVNVDIFGNADLDTLAFTGNMIQDGANELYLLQFILNTDFDNGVVNSDQIRAAWNHNWNQFLFGNMGGNLGSFLPILEPGFVETMVAFLTLGDGSFDIGASQLTGTGSYGLAAVLLYLLEDELEDFGFADPLELIPDLDDFVTIPALTATGDADGDGFTNRQEFLWFAANACGSKSDNPAILYTVAALDANHFPSAIVEGEVEGEGEGVVEGEGAMEGEGGPEGMTALADHSLDRDGDGAIGLGELLRLVQFYNAGAFHCEGGTEDGYAPGGGETTCTRHGSDYQPADWAISLSEVLRGIQFFNVGTYHCAAGTEDGYAPGPGTCPL